MKAFAIWVVSACSAVAGPVFEDRAGALPVQHIYGGGWEHFVGGGVAVLDCNGDTLPDFYAAGGENTGRLFINRTSAPGAPLAFDLGTIQDFTGVTGAYPLDVDSDGALDLMLLRVGENLLLRGDGACGFTRADWGFHGRDRWSTAFSATWEADRDWPTLAIGNYVNRDDPDGPFEACDVNELHRPRAAGYRAPILLEPGFCALSMLISDWMRIGVPELRISNDRHYYVRGGYEEMWRLDPLTPRTEADGWDRVSLWGMGIASGDISGDGLPDVMLTSMGDQLLQINEGGTLRSVPYAFGTYAQRPYQGDDGRPSTGWHAQFGDVDNDGRIDLFIAKGNVDQMPSNAMADPNNLLMQQPDGTFAEAGGAAGIAGPQRSRGAGLADFDGDGRLDLVVVNRRAPLELWQNLTPGASHWLAVEPRQKGVNSRAVGAWVTVRAGEDAKWVQEVTIGGGHGSGQAGPMHFGLGDAQEVQVQITWPDGTVDPWQMVQSDQRIEILRNTPGQ
ncbi:CRTAC1 family protein [Puniceibacterium sp. IMCC21224]|uniref:CRTAC1 family protein n=1 Tax=Puniceibacterium sp. IMCC21224 TaxID=1618204 RepID=UPI00064DD188|nr:CRTAC1 family protein [Puniceibacterium sp. IMCC21224]KMK65724.1 hypothetical protein IMCC21224_11558 [Puniceibacterium sp. IMCC21224]